MAAVLFVGTHGGLALYRGKGYCFHSCLVPCDKIAEQEMAENEQRIFVDAVPKGTNEVRLKDAEFTLDYVSDIDDGFCWLPSPQRAKPRNQRKHDYGHVWDEDREGDNNGRWNKEEIWDESEDWDEDDAFRCR